MLPPNPPAKALKIAVVLHLFHEEQWPDFAAALLNVPQPFALYVSVSPGSQIAGDIHARFPSAQIRAVPNVGRDVAPFLALLGQLQAYDLVCKLHSKRRSGAHALWRQHSVDNLIGQPETVSAYLDAFARDPELALAGPKALYIDGPAHEMQSSTALHLLYAPLPARWGFFAGTMFWCRPSCYAALPNAYPPPIFQPHNHVDGEPEHLVERVFGLIAAQQGLKVMLWDGAATLGYAAHLQGGLDWDTVQQSFAHKAAALKALA